MFIARLFDVSMPKHSKDLLSDTLHFDIHVFRNRKSVLYIAILLCNLFILVISMFEVANFLSGAGHSYTGLR